MKQTDTTPQTPWEAVAIDTRIRRWLIRRYLLIAAVLLAALPLVLIQGHAQIQTPDYGQVLIQASPTMDALSTMNAILDDVGAANYRLELAFAEAYRGQYVEAELHVTSGMALLDNLHTRYAKELTRLQTYVDGNTRHSMGWSARSFLDTMIYEVAALKDEGRKLYDVVYAATDDFPATRAALDALLIEE